MNASRRKRIQQALNKIEDLKAELITSGMVVICEDIEQCRVRRTYKLSNPQK